MASLTVHNISKSFGKVSVLRDISVDIRSGEFFSLLGPSGCGKSTLLRIIAGLESAHEGTILVDGVVIDHIPPQKRGIGMVFQQYALWPHMTIGENVRFGLENLTKSRAERDARMNEALERVQMHTFIERYPHEISGGQQQRVALARALALQPSIILLDEPLSNLDARLRAEIRHELVQLHRTIGTTMIYVTHDQEDALALSSRIAIMHTGKIEQIGTPRQIYDEPATPFVAKFIGDANLLPCRVVDTSTNDEVIVELDAYKGSRMLTRISTGARDAARMGLGGHGALCVRPSALRVLSSSVVSAEPFVEATVRHTTYRGADYDVELELTNSSIVRAYLREDECGGHVRVGERVRVQWKPGSTVFMSSE